MGIKNLIVRMKGKDKPKEDETDSLSQIKKEVEAQSEMIRNISNDVDDLNAQLLASMKGSGEEQHSKKR